ncbi:hypothetical protein C3497_08190 [Zoogloeaceae bacteirum Par-f-2]|nr:hypothetical protein C3497_08190 [Zoogloeaceae bacteirum Par-f-2]
MLHHKEHTMIKLTYTLQLASPAFLGDAAQKGVWRTPPLKALIREWWRIAVARELGYDHRRIKEREKALFGTAADDSRDGNQKSQIRLALAHWNEGCCKEWPAGESRVTHPEVKDRNTGRLRPVGSELYLGYGPLLLEKGNPNTQLKNNAALQAGEDNQLRLALPPGAEAQALQRAITLAHWFGTIGGRSRNGWGSLLWQAADGTPAPEALSRTTLEQTGCTRALRDCLALDWPHAIGSDTKGVLVWRSSQTFKDWRSAMKFLAQTKIDFRTHLDFTTGKNSPRVEPRHVLAYPVTNHSVGQWGNNARLANTLRFKLHREGDGLRALIYHTPCKPTLPHGNLGLPGIFDTWQKVHRFLDDQPTLTRLA